MQFTFPIYLGWRFSRGGTGDRFSRLISRLSMIGIILGVASLIIVSSVMNGFEARLKQNLLSVLPHAIITKNSDQNLSLDFSKLPEIKSQTEVIDGEAILQSASAIAAGRLLGTKDFLDTALAPYLIRGTFYSLDHPGDYHLIIGDSLAKMLNVKLGDQIRVMVTSASTFTPLGRIPRQRLFKVTGIFATYTDIDSQTLYTNLEDGGRVLGKDIHKVQSYQLTFDDPFNVPSFQKRFEQLGWQWDDWRTQRGTLFQAVKMEKNMMSIMLSLIVFIAVFNLISSLIMVVMDKQKEVAILKTLGLTRNRVMAVFIVQGGHSGLFGALIGGFIGIVASNYLNEILSLFNVGFVASLGGSLPVVMVPFQIITIIITSILLTLIATLYPSYRAASFHPAQVLRYE